MSEPASAIAGLRRSRPEGAATPPSPTFEEMLYASSRYETDGPQMSTPALAIRTFLHLRVGQVVAERGRVSARVATAEGAVGEIDVPNHLEDAAEPREHEVQRDPVQVVDV